MNNQNSIGVVLLLLLVFAALDGGNAGPVPGSAAALVRPPARPPHLAALAKDFHRMVGIMGKVDNPGHDGFNSAETAEGTEGFRA